MIVQNISHLLEYNVEADDIEQALRKVLPAITVSVDKVRMKQLNLWDWEVEVIPSTVSGDAYVIRAKFWLIGHFGEEPREHSISITLSRDAYKFYRNDITRTLAHTIVDSLKEIFFLPV